MIKNSFEGILREKNHGFRVAKRKQKSSIDLPNYSSREKNRAKDFAGGKKSCVDKI